ncbi:DUF1570 domain-containing protein [Lacipirellula parvula]|uniref:DUF1570 domain-containing protein n=1 Tax=Lacipirellula parvula TaxID=2650471 RepID=A0A5K7XB49_9BACT|nr:DUF1570 domain-containing protein [Lacipirellula parvula]BBO31543.1 hypothetical protein PLANPX_1155 [Lacipirellula parvula]
MATISSTFRWPLAFGVLLATLVASSPLPSAQALERLTVALPDQPPKQLVGEAIVEARDGGMLLKTADGAIHRLPAATIRNRKTDSEKLVPLTREELTKQLLAELPPGFRIHDSKNYIVCYNTTRTYAEWTSSLLERLQKAFIAYWKKQKSPVETPEQPLVVLVFADQASYADYAKKDLGSSVSNIIGYYNLETNRIMMYDLTGMQAFRQNSGDRGSLHDISQLLSQPQAEPLVATIVHEATHQIAFNCGLQTRMVANPYWLTEGMATFFETPNLSSSRSWSGIGNVNYSRFDLFRDNYSAGKIVPLERMLSDDKLFTTPETAVDSYAQAWAWNYFLIQTRPKEYAGYLKMIAEKPLLLEDKKGQRVREFRQHFGDDLAELEDAFYRKMDRVK